MSTVVILSIGIQLIAAIWALRLIPDTGHKISWILIAIGLIGMVHRRVHTLILTYQNGVQPDLTFELIGLVVSLIMLIGILQLRPFFRQLKQSSDKLAASEERFRTVADFTYDWEYWRGVDGNFLYMSPSCTRTTGYPRSAFFDDPKLLEKIIHPDDRQIVIEHLVSEPITKEPGNFDFRIKTPDNCVHWISHRCVPVFDSQGKFLGTRASNSNIDSRKKIENSLKQSRKLYHDLVEQSQSIVLELDSYGRIVFINRFGQDFFGHTRDELCGRQVLGLLLPEKDCSGRELQNLFSTLFKHDSDAVFNEVEIVRKNKTKAWLSLALSLISDSPDQGRGILCVGIDITTKKAAEKLKEDVERIVRHDLKSPLIGIIGLPRIMLDADNITDRQRKMLKAMEQAGMQMMDLINQSLTLYKLESGTYEYQPESVDWLDIARRVASDLKTLKEFKQAINILVDGLPAKEDIQIIIPGDATLLYGMAANLLKNALEASGEKPVQISFSTGDPCSMEIINAQSVPNSIRKNFFEKYITSGKQSGTGLGTYSARLATQAHRGKITMKTSETNGTIVRVELPHQFNIEQ